jgi:hypothetical protein
MWFRKKKMRFRRNLQSKNNFEFCNNFYKKKILSFRSFRKNKEFVNTN